MNKILTTSLAALTLFTMQPTFATTHELNNCDQLKEPNTLVLVHASWCGHCVNFLPVYKAVSDLPSMSKYTFYTKEDDSGKAICGVTIHAFPVTFAKDMSVNLLGEVDKDELIDFVLNQA